ncbi:MAG: topoisomerase IV [Ruminococcaceae bacterium]|nr:topoisomerase IV [Oscillospiraceae bacterium]
MARSKKQPEKAKQTMDINAEIAGAGTVLEEPITETLETNYMPYAMSVIVSRAIPEIDGLKPSHRKLLYSMYKSGLLGSERKKSASIVGDTMKLNPHGDAAIYDTMVRLARGNEALLHPYVDSKGNFGKIYSKNMAYAAARYTEAKLESICKEFFADIDKDTVDFVPNYDNTMMEPTLLPTSFPNILTNVNLGIAVGMASSICSFNLEEVCTTAIELMKNPAHDILSTLKAPDFPGGGYVIYNAQELDKIYKTGRGSVKVRAKYTYDKSQNCIDITEIPYTATIETIIDKVIELVKAGKIKEISDIRDESDLRGLKITIDLRRSVDPDKLMAKLFKMTALEDNFPCNFNILIGTTPKVMGVGEILEEWTAFRRDCVRRRTYFTLTNLKNKLHLLRGLEAILLDIDKAIRIVRETEEEQMVVPNLMIGFGIDEVQAEYVAEIRLRNLNREYIIKRTEEIARIQDEVYDLEDIVNSRRRIDKIIIAELEAVIKKYAKPRKTQIEYNASEYVPEPEQIPDYPVNLFFTKDGYFKKITPLSLRMGSEHKLKTDDEIMTHIEGTNLTELLFFTDKQQVYKAKVCDFEDHKASVLGDYIPAKLGMDEGEKAIYMVTTTDYKGHIMLFFENGKAAKIPMSAFETKSNRKKLTAAYSDKSPLVALFASTEEREYIVKSSAGRYLIVHSGAVALKTSRSTQGVAAMTLKKNHIVEKVTVFTEDRFVNANRYRTKNIPATGSVLAANDAGEQLTF